MHSAQLTVRGTAPPGAEIVRDSGFWFWGDEQILADGSGSWSHSVELEEGDNQLTFWLADDESEMATVSVRYEPPSVATPTPRPTPRPTPTPSPRPRPAATLEDNRGDLSTFDDEPTDGPGYADILELVVEIGDDDLDLTLRLAAPPPRLADPLSEEVIYGFLIDVDVDGYPDYQVLLQNTGPSGEYEASICRCYGDEPFYVYADDEFPGRGSTIGDLATVRVDLSFLGNPARVGAVGLTEHRMWRDFQNRPLDFEEGQDKTPDHQWPDDDGEWVFVEAR